MKTAIEQAFTSMSLEPELVREILDYGRLKKARAGQLIIGPDSASKELPLVLNGVLKVMKQDRDGNEIFLYYLEGGDTCAMSITCCIEGKLNRFKVLAEEDSELWMIPMAYVDGWVQKYSSFRKYVFDAYQSRFDELLETIESIAFMNMDQRLLKFLLDKKQATGSYVIQMTHQQIANELNSSRVVVSRLLKQLERQQKIQQYRNRIEIL
jgi:CRP/FNR family transcriptional regulator